MKFAATILAAVSMFTFAMAEYNDKYVPPDVLNLTTPALTVIL